MKDLYNIDISENQKPKLLQDIPEVDIVIKMGCNVVCPFLPAKHIEDWGIDDPTGKKDEEFIKVIELIKNKVLDLKGRIEKKEI